mmetsp:Transcript_17664/g.24661  ORF Transcript_17664/g.24661 Transcript_17664/m.24661 type:complete len:291 (-) Transcript_17664:297-1169(-)
MTSFKAAARHWFRQYILASHFIICLRDSANKMLHFPGKRMRFVTAIVYLTSLSHDEGGQTVFPCALRSREDTPSLKKRRLKNVSGAIEVQDDGKSSSSGRDDTSATAAAKWLIDQGILHTSSAFAHHLHGKEDPEMEGEATKLVKHADQIITRAENADASVVANHCHPDEEGQTPQQQQQQQEQQPEKFKDTSQNAESTKRNRTTDPRCGGAGLVIKPERGMLCLFYSVDPTQIKALSKRRGGGNSKEGGRGGEAAGAGDRCNDSWLSDYRSWHGGARVVMMIMIHNESL